jgi:hypothetical protein
MDMPAVYMQAKYSKNKLPRTIYWSTEVKEQAWRLKLDKYGYNKPDPEDLVFGIAKGADPQGVYERLAENFRDHLDRIGFEKRLPGLGRRHEVTLYSFRRYVETTVEDNTSANYADYILGHKKSPYYNHGEPERRKIYLEKCAVHLVYFNYKELEQELANKENQILHFQDVTSKEVQNMMRRMAATEKELADLKKERSLGAPAPSAI